MTVKRWIVNDLVYKTVDYFSTEREAVKFASDVIENRDHYAITVSQVKKELMKP
jgi:hypothetical protein